MKKLALAILTTGLLSSSILMANDTVNDFYPLENNDTPDYILNNEINDHSNNTSKLDESIINKNALSAFYPIENNDTPDYLLGDNKNATSSIAYTNKSSIDDNTLCAIYPEEHSDAPTYLKSC